MAGVQAVADGHRRVLVGQLVNRSQLLEAASNVRSGPGCILEQDRQVAGAETLRGLCEAEHEGSNPFFHRMAPVTARVNHYVFGADHGSTLELAPETVDRPAADGRIQRSQVDQ